MIKNPKDIVNTIFINNDGIEFKIIEYQGFNKNK